MKWKIEKKYIKGAISLLAVILIAMLFQYGLSHSPGDSETMQLIATTFRPIIGGCIFAYLLNPILRFFEGYIFGPIGKLIWKTDEAKTKKFSRALGIVCTMVAFFVIVIGGLYLVSVITSTGKLSKMPPSYSILPSTRMDPLHAPPNRLGWFA